MFKLMTNAKLLNEFGRSASAMLLFLKNLEQINIYHRNSKGVTTRLYSVSIQNVTDELRRQRALVNEYARQVLRLKETPRGTSLFG